jgi:6-pyruvoyl-tetrahydropterin synthase
MESLISVRSYFHGSHSLKDHPECGWDCGHTWNVEILVAGEENHERFSMPVDEAKLQAELHSIKRELSGKDIDKLIKPSVSSIMGIAHWYYERLASRYDVREVQVWQDNGTVRSILRGP